MVAPDDTIKRLRHALRCFGFHEVTFSLGPGWSFSLVQACVFFLWRLFSLPHHSVLWSVYGFVGFDLAHYPIAR